MKKHPIIFIIAFNLLLIIGQFILTNSRSVDGREIARISQQIDQLNQVNAQIRKEILSATSITALMQLAQDKSLVPLTVAIASPLSVAAVNP